MNSTHMKGKEYILPLTDKQGKQWKIRAIGMDEMTTEISPTMWKKYKKTIQKACQRPRWRGEGLKK